MTSSRWPELVAEAWPTATDPPPFRTTSATDGVTASSKKRRTARGGFATASPGAGLAPTRAACAEACAANTPAAHRETAIAPRTFTELPEQAGRRPRPSVRTQG